MTISPLQTWRDQYELLELVSDDSWKQNLADYLGDLLDNAFTLSTYTPAPIFTFDRTTFASLLDSGVDQGIASLKAAFQSAIQSSTMFVSVGSYIGSSTPATTYSVVASVVPDPPSILAGQNKIQELEFAQATSDPQLSEFPEKLRDAFLLVTYTVTGTNSVAPTPSPLTDTGRSVE